MTNKISITRLPSSGSTCALQRELPCLENHKKITRSVTEKKKLYIRNPLIYDCPVKNKPVFDALMDLTNSMLKLN